MQNGRSYLLSLHETPQQTGNRRWGFIIYRCTNEDQPEWRRSIRTLKRIDHLNIWNEWFEMLSKYESTRREYRARFENATVNEVREHFKGWRASDAMKRRKLQRTSIMAK